MGRHWSLGVQFQPCSLLPCLPWTETMSRGESLSLSSPLPGILSRDTGAVNTHTRSQVLPPCLSSRAFRAPVTHCERRVQAPLCSHTTSWPRAPPLRGDATFSSSLGSIIFQKLYFHFVCTSVLPACRYVCMYTICMVPWETRRRSLIP